MSTQHSKAAKQFLKNQEESDVCPLARRHILGST